MGEDWRWLIGMIVTGIITAVASFRVLADRTRLGDDALHERVNRVRDELGRDFVRKSDLDGHLGRIDKNVQDLRDEAREAQRETHRRLDTVISAISKERLK